MAEPAAPPARPLRLGLFMSLALGHKTQFLNWQRVLAGYSARVSPLFVPLPTTVDGTLLEKVPLVPELTRRKINDWFLIRGAVRKGALDAVLMNPYGLAVNHLGVLREHPTFLLLDATRRQFEGLTGYYQATTESGPFGALRHRRQRAAIHGAAGLFPASEWAARSLVEDYGAAPEKVHVIPAGVDPTWFTPAPEKRPRDGKLRVLFVGGDFQRKGGDLLLRWAETTAQKDFEVHVVTGRALPPAANVTQHAAANNSTTLLELYQRSDLLVLPTRADCSPLVTMEAMACGLPVVATRVGGVSEVIAEGETGFVIPPGDFGALAERLDACSRDRHKLADLGRAARQRVLTRYDLNVLIPLALSIIERAR
ncbi:MAG: glycosyltransferase family 4 protein [Deltaproteobacteria bacterium]|nr:glycosyltransferase family 4 protein [Deltaproteobacteria bacterium]